MSEKTERTVRRRAMRLLAAGHPPSEVVRRLGRSRGWLSKWRQRYGQAGVKGLHAHSRRPRQCPQAWPASLRKMIVQTRRRLVRAPVGLVGARAIRRELRKLMPRRSLPSERTIGRVLCQAKLITPQTADSSAYFPAPSEELLGSLDALDWTCRYLEGGAKIYAFHTLNLRTRAMTQTLADNKSLATVRQHVLEAWKTQGIPRFLQTDNDAIFCGGYKAPRVFGTFLRLCLFVGVELIFLPFAEPKCNSAVERLNGLWGGAAFWQRHHFRCPGDVHRLSPAFLSWYRDDYTPPMLAGLTPGQAQGCEDRPRLTRVLLHGLPDPLPITAGRVHFLRRVQPEGTIRLLNEAWRVGQRLAGHYVWATLTTHRHTLEIWHRRNPHSDWILIKHVSYEIVEPVRQLESNFAKLFTMS